MLLLPELGLEDLPPTNRPICALFYMPRVSDLDRLRDKTVAQQLLRSAPTAIKTGKPHDKAIYLFQRGIRKATISAVVPMPKTTTDRTIDSWQNGRAIAKKGRHPYLTEIQELDLEKWCIRENSAGRGPPVNEVLSKVQYPFLDLAFAYNTFLTDRWVYRHIRWPYRGGGICPQNGALKRSLIRPR